MRYPKDRLHHREYNQEIIEACFMDDFKSSVDFNKNNSQGKRSKSPQHRQQFRCSVLSLQEIGRNGCHDVEMRE